MAIRNSTLSACAVLLVALSFPLASGAGYLKIDQIDGESTDDAHKDWIDIDSFGHSIQRTGDPAIGATSRSPVDFSDLAVTKRVDKSTPLLMEAATKGLLIPAVQLHLARDYDSGAQVYFAYELTNVRVTSYAVGGDTQGDAPPTEDISLNFEEIKVTYTEHDNQGRSKGNVEYTWKVEEGES